MSPPYVPLKNQEMLTKSHISYLNIFSLLWIFCIHRISRQTNTSAINIHSSRPCSPILYCTLVRVKPKHQQTLAEPPGAESPEPNLQSFPEPCGKRKERQQGGFRGGGSKKEEKQKQTKKEAKNNKQHRGGGAGPASCAAPPAPGGGFPGWPPGCRRTCPPRAPGRSGQGIAEFPRGCPVDVPGERCPVDVQGKDAPRISEVFGKNVK